MKQRTGFSTTSAGLLAFALCTPLQAAMITLEGATVDFSYDDTAVSPAYGNLFVATTATGALTDVIMATPTGYRAESVGGIGVHNNQPVDTFNALGTVYITTKAGYQLDGVSVRERGTYNMTAGGTAVSVGSSLDLFDAVDFIFGPAEFTSMTSTGDLTLRDGVNHGWQGTGAFDLSTAIWDGVNKVGLQLSETLTATSTLGSTEVSWIEKTSIGGGIQFSVTTTPEVPIPGAVWLFGSGLLGLMGLSRRRR